MTSSHPAAVHLRDVTVHFAGRTRPALVDVDLAVAPGERVVLRGPSGGGKSTLLHVITGIVPQSIDADVFGQVRVLGRDPGVDPVPWTALRVGWLGQDPASNACLPTVADEVALPLENRGIPVGLIGERVRELLTQVDAAHLVDRRTSTLSGGEQQRVALAAVLAGEPSVLLLDEPTSMLDPVATARVLDLIEQHSRGRTTMLVDHRTGSLWADARTVWVDGAGRVADVVRAGAADGPASPWCGLVRASGRYTGPGGRRRAGSGDRLATPPRTGDLVLRLRNAGFDQQDRRVVDGVDLDLRRGQVTAVVGTNGSGKSSLLLGMAGLLPGDTPRGYEQVGLVFQRAEHQFIARTVAGELRAGRSVTGRGAASADRDMLVRLGLDRLAAADPFRLSGGQQRRLSVAAVAVLDRPVLLVDEPTLGLDAMNARSVVDLLLEVAVRGTAVVLVTHDLALARAIADQVLVLAAGRVHAVGGPALLDDDLVLSAAGLRARGRAAPARGSAGEEPVRCGATS